MKNALFALWFALTSSLLVAQSIPANTTATSSTGAAVLAITPVATKTDATTRQVYVIEDYCTFVSGVCDYAAAYESFISTVGVTASTPPILLLSTAPGAKCVQETMRIRHSVEFRNAAGSFPNECSAGGGNAGEWDSASVAVTGATMTLQGTGAPTTWQITLPSTSTVPVPTSNYAVKVGCPGCRSGNFVISVDDATHITVAQAPHQDIYGHVTIGNNVIADISDINSINTGNTLTCTSGIFSGVVTVSSIDYTNNAVSVQIASVNANATASQSIGCVEGGVLGGTLTFQKWSPMFRIGQEQSATTCNTNLYGYCTGMGISGVRSVKSYGQPGMGFIQIANGDNVSMHDNYAEGFQGTCYTIGGANIAQSTANGRYAITNRESKYPHNFSNDCGDMATGQSNLEIVNGYTTFNNGSIDGINTLDFSGSDFNATYGPANIYIGSANRQAGNNNPPRIIDLSDLQSETGNYLSYPANGSVTWNAKSTNFWCSECGSKSSFHGGFINAAGFLKPLFQLDDQRGIFTLSGATTPPRGGIPAINIASLTVTNGSTAISCASNCFNTLLMGNDTTLAIGGVATFTATGSSTNLTVTSVTGTIQIPSTISGTGVLAPTTIVSQTSGTAGGAGVYVTSQATTSIGATLTAGNYYTLSGAPSSSTTATLSKNYAGTSGTTTAEIVSLSWILAGNGILYGQTPVVSINGIGLTTVPDTAALGATGLQTNDLWNTSNFAYVSTDLGVGTQGRRISAGSNIWQESYSSSLNSNMTVTSNIGMNFVTTATWPFDIGAGLGGFTQILGLDGRRALFGYNGTNAFAAGGSGHGFIVCANMVSPPSCSSSIFVDSTGNVGLFPTSTTGDVTNSKAYWLLADGLYHGGAATQANGDSSSAVATDAWVYNRTLRTTTPITLSGAQQSIFTWSLSAASSVTMAWDCHIIYTITAGAVSTLTLGMNPSVAPTGMTGHARIYSTNTGTSTDATVSSTSSGNTNILTGAVAATGTYEADLYGTIVTAASASIFNLSATLTGTASAGTIAAGSSCSLQ